MLESISVKINIVIVIVGIGEKVIVPAPKTLEALAERKNSNLEMVDWYLAKKSL
jgi:hypothetical protein